MCSVASFAMRIIKLRWEKPALPYGELLRIISINQMRTADIKSSCMRNGLGLTAPQHEVPACYEIRFCRRSVVHLLRNFGEGRQCYDAFAWPLLPWKRNNSLQLHCWSTRFAVNNLINIESIVMEAQQCVPRIVALHMSLPAVWYILTSSCKAPDIFVLF
jgi:hypothetical protein